ncbi:bifunctional 4-hydroxy-2-oxoglutarate aldolase/2-dehydro-3-deoxy-phosphogluconate aldolase [Vibrio salinus]|uniref:bifunctional 4-hydroxy-2-oxoglutarate aldolase/2-dehydro-3-deoxy-phosphogluconate aldolase n=1 Tax=Vibrio salinus TaxID=2899784 RepID=UPI001E64A991|nr:bifunctional 4-hydroxy-2-oxoglutarate aldolase/2-dehydro-3-deoxy-phosphogluconate aldolase [Vibrio salinus]MCE0492419.1 bifunctional 4-hydroxy-2-oxoglutarate aldolase/2-dehydro-3-deoxy-phosphogluconate aldolase [Vibrio salinus]
MNTIIEQISALKIIPVIAIDDAEDIIPLGKALVENGLPVAEITFRSSSAGEAIRLLRQSQPDMLIGAGTVLTQQQIFDAKNAGATFIVTPGFNPNIVRTCQDLNIPIIPGINNPTALEAAVEMGLTTLKFFPAEASGGISMIKSLTGPYRNVKFMPTGGINPGNIQKYLSVPEVICCGGSWMVDKTMIANRDWDKLATLIRQSVELVK